MSKELNNFGLSVHDPFKSSLCVSVSSRELQCSTWPVGVLHPVRAQLERFEAGPGCAAREGGAKENPCDFCGQSLQQTSMRYLPARIFPVGVQTSHLGVLSAGNCGVKTFDRLSAINWPVILVLSSQHTGIGCWKMRAVTQHQCTGAGV